MRTALEDRPADRQHSINAGPRPRCGREHLLTGLLAGREVTLLTDRPVPEGPVHRLLGDLAAQWDPRRRHSDLDRLTHHPCLVCTVCPVTLVLVRNACSAVRVAQRAGVIAGPCDAVLDVRHHRVGLDPTAAAITARLVPATAADLLVDLSRGHGALTGSVRVGDVRRDLQDPVPAWLRQVAADLHESATASIDDGDDGRGSPYHAGSTGKPALGGRHRWRPAATVDGCSS